jgi:TrmH family RNA methyltransferase
MQEIEITSVNNELVKSTVRLHQKKYRDEEKKFLLEGFKPVEEAINSGLEVEFVFVDKKAFASRRLSFLPQQNNINLILANEAVLKKISTTDSAPEVVAVAKQKVFTLDDLKSAKKVILLEGIKDSGNLGTILRSAKAFSQDAVVLYGDTVDLYNPKCVRSAVGNLWKLPVVHIKDFEVLKTTFENFEKVATLPLAKDTIALKDFSAKSPYLVMFGSEAGGLSDELINFSDKKLTIEMNSDVESLNLSVSAAVVMYQLM